MEIQGVENNHRIQHLPVLDGIRGIAILLVMTFHFFWFAITYNSQIQIEPGSLAEWLKNLVFSGWTGVDLFFILSGFLITGILIDTKQDTHYFRNFYIRRIFRIFPLYYLFLVMWLFLKNCYPPQITSGADPYYLAWLWTYTQNVLIAVKGWSSVPGPFLHFWTLAIEEQFYLFWPFLILLLSRRRAMILCGLILIASPALRWILVLQDQVWAAYILTPCRLDTLAAGALLALLFRELGDLQRLIKVLRAGACISFALLVGLFFARQGLRGDDPPVTVLGLSLLALFFCWFVAEGVLLKSSGTGHRILNHSCLRWFGKYSYCLYVVHQPVVLLVAVSGFIGNIMVLFNLHSICFYFALYFFIPLLISMLIAKISWRFWESLFLCYRETLIR